MRQVKQREVLSPNLCLCLALGLGFSTLIPSGQLVALAQAQEQNQGQELTEARLNSLSAQIENNKTRMTALSTLIKQCHSLLYPTSSNMMLYPDAKSRKLYERAVATVNRCATIPTLKLALQGTDEDLHYWALRQIGPKQKVLLPYVQALTTPGRSVWANQALETLRCLRVSEPDIKKQVELSKDTSVLLHQVHDEGEFNRRLSLLLDDPSEKVRKDALDFIAYNENMAEMYHKTFDAKIFDQVLHLSMSTAVSFRESSVPAIAATAKFGEALALSRLEALAKDPSSDVRWRVAVAMKKFSGSRAAAMTAALLKDDSPTVRYFAVLADGPAKHVDILRALVKCSDASISNEAASQLKALENEKK